jgi:uncharacterized protein (TIGR03083 family)
MSDNTVDLTPATQRLADLVARVRDDELNGPTPCPAYTLGDLIEHVGGLALAFRAAAEKDTASPYAVGRRGPAAGRLAGPDPGRLAGPDPGRSRRSRPGLGEAGRVDRDDPDR